MPIYNIEAMNVSGEMVHSRLVAATEDEAIARVREMGFFVTRISEAAPSRGLWGWFKRLLGLEPPLAPVPPVFPQRPAAPRTTAQPTRPTGTAGDVWQISWGGPAQVASAAAAAAGETRQVPTPAAKPPTSASLDLDAGDFLPIGREELKRGAEQARASGNPWFGRRDVIPPADDPRTKLIDRGLVTHGLLAPEQLVEIHEVGAQMEKIRPALQQVEVEAAQAGQTAVELDREQRRASKEQKKREAEERKQRRQAEIAQRRATDIIFLGRGVSGQLNERLSDRARLTLQGLPVLGTPTDLANALGLTIAQLRGLAFHSEVARRIHYVTFTVPKRSGGVRTLSAPHRRLAGAQQWILDDVLKRLPTTPPAHGFVTGRSIVTNAQPHTGKALVVNLDLEDFFPSIAFPRVRSVFWRLGYSPCVATILALLCTECPRRLVQYDGKPYWVATGPRGLPQGACTSPALSNQVAQRLDRRLHGLAQKLGWTYTRYADDLTFSGGAELANQVGYLMARVRHIAGEEGFAVNEKKSRVLRRSAAQKVTGLVVNDRPSLSRREVRRLRAILHRARREGLQRQNRDQRRDYRAWLRGKIAFLAMVRPEVGQRLRAELRAIPD